ncbi:MAG: hypothetical protein HN712_02840 [Gemmatimonadetes bacterium]|jgi:hypothetical protein|nr:hypothetical protein [Gemmatimonadota bacterium]MBT7859214.1 hypothetical protein [Gemmatimonadota bacterium]
MGTSLLFTMIAANSYLDIPDPDMRLVYGLFGAAVGIFLVLAIVRFALRLRENKQVERSSWRTFDKLSSVKGLSRLEARILTNIARKDRTKRPSQLLASIQMYDRLVDRAADRGWVVDDDLVHLELARQKLLRTSRPWDGQERRNFERAKCTFEIQTTVVTKNAIDEELKTTYTETDEKFLNALSGLIEAGVSESTRILDLSAGGLGLLTQDKGQYNTDDYVSFSQGTDQLPFSLASIYGRILDVERMEGEGQAIVHVAFMPYEAEIRKQVIQVVYDTASQVDDDQSKAKKKTRAKKKVAKKKAAPRAAADTDPTA